MFSFVFKWFLKDFFAGHSVLGCQLFFLSTHRTENATVYCPLLFLGVCSQPKCCSFDSNRPLKKIISKFFDFGFPQTNYHVPNYLIMLLNMCISFHFSCLGLIGILEFTGSHLLFVFKNS